ncbi:MAG TPA: hypothetical protein DCE14_06435 [Kosmotogaceae bacterium]|nr:hypothetical protein [Kosmotogaceae bacterium]
MECSNLDKNLENCNCTYPGCPRKGRCCECLNYHRRNNELPACYFTKGQEETWDRSISFFKKCS